MAGASSSALMDLVSTLEAPFLSSWATLKDHDARPFGGVMWLPKMAVAYFVSLTALKLFAGVGAKGENGEPGGALEKPLKYFALVNNVLMCAYSAWAFVAVAALVVSNWAPAAGPSQLFCDPERGMLKGMDFQMYIFFLSKFWEWIDTWVLVLKGKGVWPPENEQYFLHIFHHTTTATVGWLAWRQELTVAWIGPLTNAFVHTLMYAYYALVDAYPGVRKYGLYITPIQILQFILCLGILMPEAIDALTNEGKRCGMTKRAAVWMLFAYGTYLVFFWKMFQLKKEDARAKKLAAKES